MKFTVLCVPGDNVAAELRVSAPERLTVAAPPLRSRTELLAVPVENTRFPPIVTDPLVTATFATRPEVLAPLPIVTLPAMVALPLFIFHAAVAVKEGLLITTFPLTIKLVPLNVKEGEDDPERNVRAAHELLLVIEYIPTEEILIDGKVVEIEPPIVLLLPLKVTVPVVVVNDPPLFVQLP